jgi:hypothetical protein
MMCYQRLVIGWNSLRTMISKLLQGSSTVTARMYAPAYDRTIAEIK